MNLSHATFVPRRGWWWVAMQELCYTRKWEEQVSRSKPKQLAAHTSVSPAVAAAGAVASSLPPTPSRVPAPPTTPSKRLNYPKQDSLIRKKAIAIVAMRAQGYSTEEIASELGIRARCVAQYVYTASRGGWLPRTKGSAFDDPKDTIDFELAHKAVRNMNEFLDSKDLDTRKEATFELAKGAIYKRFDQPREATLPGMQVLAIKIDMPTAGDTTVREGSMGGSPIYEGAVHDVDQPD